MGNKSNQSVRMPEDAAELEFEEIASLAGEGGQIDITCIDFNAENIEVREVKDLDDFVRSHRPEWSAVRWINVDGLSDYNAIHLLATKYNLHPLAIEDVLDSRQRPKIESYGGLHSEQQARLFIVARLPEIIEDRLDDNQVSIFVGHNTVLSFLQRDSDIWQPVLLRIMADGSRIRNSDAGFLAYSLLDAVVDSFYGILENIGRRAEQMEDEILEHVQPEIIGDIHQIKRDVQRLQRMMWPMREIVSSLQRDPNECISETSRVYLRDLYDHVIQIMDIIERNRELVSDLTETYMSRLSNRANEIMKVLSIIGTIFLPLTFLAGVYGMNFRYFPELNFIWSYPAFWLICIGVVTVMLLMFRRRKWL